MKVDSNLMCATVNTEMVPDKANWVIDKKTGGATRRPPLPSFVNLFNCSYLRTTINFSVIVS